MRVLVVGPSPTRSKGGMATVINDILKDRNLNSTFDIDIFESYIDGRKSCRYIYSVWAYIKFFLMKRNYDVYHIHMASRGSTFRKRYYVTTVKKWNKKVILHIHGAQYMEFYNECDEKNKEKIVHVLKAADMVIALSSEWKKKFDSTFGLTNCVILENGINTDSFKEAITPVEQNRNTFLMLGRQGKRKGSYDLIEAVEMAVHINPNILVYLAGDGDVEIIKSIVKEKKLENNIKVVGWIDFEAKISLLKMASTVVLPSYNEGLPMSVLEGMASGKAIISTTVGAIPEVIKDENGILVMPGDVEGLAKALLKLSIDQSILERMSKSNAEKAIKQFSMTAMHKKMTDYYKKVYNIK